MNLILVLFVASSLLLMAILLWAVRPTPTRLKSVEEVFETLSAPRHYYRLPQILQSLKKKDTEFLFKRGKKDLARRIRRERRAIALQFVNLLEADYKTLLDASRMLAAMAPEVPATQEWQRLQMSVRFSWSCTVLRFRLRSGLAPWASFAQLSDMASHASYRMEAATRHIAERALRATGIPSGLQERGGETR